VPQTELISLPTETKDFLKNIRNTLRISLRELVLLAEPISKTLLLCFNKSVTKTHSNNKFSLEVDLSTLGLFNSLKAAKTECQMPTIKEVTLR
jgi:hypothetical protein